MFALASVLVAADVRGHLSPAFRYHLREALRCRRVPNRELVFPVCCCYCCYWCCEPWWLPSGPSWWYCMLGNRLTTTRGPVDDRHCVGPSKHTTSLSFGPLTWQNAIRTCTPSLPRCPRTQTPRDRSWCSSSGHRSQCQGHSHLGRTTGTRGSGWRSTFFSQRARSRTPSRRRNGA